MGDDEADIGLPMPKTVEVPLGIQLQGPNFAADVQMLIGLGSVIRASTQVEFALRSLFCALEGSKYAAVTAAGQPAGWLLDGSKWLVKCRKDLSVDYRARLSEILRDAESAMQDRNRYAHDVWVGGIDDNPQLMRSRRGDHNLAFRAVSLDALIETSQTLTRCAVALTHWTYDALGAHSASHEAQLRWEDYLESLTPEERASLADRRSRS